MAKCLSAKAGHDFSIPYLDYERLITSPCAYCGASLKEETGRGLDRLNNARGYSIDNVLPCCGPCNRARAACFTVEEMRDILGPAIAKVRQQRALSYGGLGVRGK